MPAILGLPQDMSRKNEHRAFIIQTTKQYRDILEPIKFQRLVMNPP